MVTAKGCEKGEANLECEALDLEELLAHEGAEPQDLLPPDGRAG